MHVYEIQPTKAGATLISKELPFGKLRYGGANAVENAIGYAKFFSRAHEMEIVVRDEAGEVAIVQRFDARRGTDLIR